MRNKPNYRLGGCGLRAAMQNKANLRGACPGSEEPIMPNKPNSLACWSAAEDRACQTNPILRLVGPEMPAPGENKANSPATKVHHGGTEIAESNTNPLKKKGWGSSSVSSVSRWCMTRPLPRPPAYARPALSNKPNFRRFGAGNEGRAEKQTQSVRAGGPRLAITDCGLGIRGNGGVECCGAKCQTKPICRAGELAAGDRLRQTKPISGLLGQKQGCAVQNEPNFAVGGVLGDEAERAGESA